jgi:putative membrane protein
MIAVSLYALLISYLELHNVLSNESKELTKGISAIYSILGFTLSLLLVFRTNTAYDRWWDGRKLWGELTNASRAFSAHMNAMIPKSSIDSRMVLSKYIGLFAHSLQAHLKKERVSEEYLKEELDDEVFKEIIPRFSNSYHQPHEIYAAIVEHVQLLNTQNLLGNQEIYHFKSEINKLIDVCGGCERIMNTPIPFSYSVFIKKFIFFYVMLFPIIYGIHMSYFIIPATVFILYVLSSIELIAEEIEDPFNGDPNDLPTLEMANNIKKSANAILFGNIENNQ